jgi:hypothetical protein
MALQSSGQISIGDIRTEIGSSSGSLRTLSAAAGKSTPDAISEFYGYSNVTLTSFSSSLVSNFSGVCSASVTATYYHDGPFTYPDVGDTVYSNSSGSSYLGSGYYKLGSGDFMNVGSSGSVTSVDPCGFP